TAANIAYSSLRPNFPLENSFAFAIFNPSTRNTLTIVSQRNHSPSVVNNAEKQYAFEKIIDRKSELWKYQRAKKKNLTN
ncbi:hypothetical protein, partial [Winogradskyella vidalii]|uniref:hypothetical protein n=1 Tax=Winogradskyella vidalii TaxID=2615024 RepID=UPI001C5449FD